MDRIDRETAEARARAKVGFATHALTYVAVMSALAIVNVVTSPQRLWFVWPLAGWGLGLALHGVRVFALERHGIIERFMIDREMRRRT